MSESDEIVSGGLVEKNDMKVSLSPSDGDVVPYTFFRSERVSLKVSQITIRESGIADSFVPGHAENGKIYDAGKLIKFDDDLGGFVWDEPYLNMWDNTLLFWDRNKP